MGFDDSTPPDMFTGRSPSSWVTPSSTYFQPSPLGRSARFSSHIGSNQENGTYISTQSTSRARVGDAGLLVDVGGALAAARAGAPCRGSADIVGSERIAVPLIHATGPGRASATSSLASTMAQAPSELGQVSA